MLDVILFIGTLFIKGFMFGVAIRLFWTFLFRVEMTFLGLIRTAVFFGIAYTILIMWVIGQM
jgi:hypothetical protein